MNNKGMGTIIKKAFHQKLEITIVKTYAIYRLRTLLVEGNQLYIMVMS